MQDIKDEDIVEVKIKKSEVNFIVWFIPFVAVVIGIWMIYSYYAKVGPMITITFRNSGGLEPKHSPVKFRDVRVGTIQKVEILKESEKVKVYVRMNKDIKPFLNQDTQFWIVKPEINLGKIQGLDALMSGAYIQMQGRVEKGFKKSFAGLSSQPLSFHEEDGVTYKLLAENSYDFSVGTPIYYKQTKVGKVKMINITDKKQVEIYIYIKKKFSKFINPNTKFWSLRNFTINLTDRGIKVEGGSISQLLMGGIEFDTKDFITKNKKSNTFYLYPTKDEAWRKRIGEGKEKYVDFLLRFDEGVGYLSIGSSVRLDGFVIGKVKDIISYYDTKNLKTNSLVLVTLDISTFQRGKRSAFLGLKQAVKNGLVAKLEKINPLVDYLYIKLVKSNQSNQLIKDGRYYLLPTKKANFSDISKSVKEFFKKVGSYPIDKTLENLNKSLVDFSRLMRDYRTDSSFGVKLEETLKDIDKASKKLGNVLNKVQKKPNSLIFGE